MMKIDSVKELEDVFAKYPCDSKLPEDSYRKSRYIHKDTFNNMIHYELNFEPYIEIARRCAMTELTIMRSTKTNRFYIGFMNLGGHGANWEVRPVGLTEVKDHQYLEQMFSDHGRELDPGIDMNETYDI